MGLALCGMDAAPAVFVFYLEQGMAKTTFDPITTLAQLDAAKIAEQRQELEAQRNAMVSDINRQIDALRVFEKAVDIRDNGSRLRLAKGGKKPKAAKPDAPKAGTLKDRIKAYLEVQGKAKQAIIAADLEAHQPSVYQTLNQSPELFERTGTEGEWRLKR